MISEQDNTKDSTHDILKFEDYELDVAAFELRHKGQVVPLEPQVFALLSYLIQNRDKLVTKDELLDELWGHRFVSESALATQIKSLRRSVGDDGRSQRVIKTIHGRGYRFVAELVDDEAKPTSTAEPEIPVPVQERPQHNLPRERTPLYGRDQDLKACGEVVAGHRLVSILGIGGAGKTRLSAAVGRELLNEFPDGVWFVDLIPVTHGEAIDDAIANNTRLALTEGNARSQVVESFRNRKMLVILDNCEHLKDDIADALDYFLDHTDEPRFLLTSREPINLADEHRYFLKPLDLPAAHQLFVATAERHGVSNINKNSKTISQICAHLDGLPLAVELAAAQLRYLSLEELAGRLDRRFQVLSGKERSASERQSNLGAVLEDTWKLLGEDERRLLGQLAVFPSRFTMTDVEELLEDISGVPAAMSRLVDLCLLSRSSENWWRLLETVREFAREQLDSEELMERYTERHANWCINKLGEYPYDHLDNLVQARWCLEHHDDLLAAESYLQKVGRTEDAMFMCCATGLMIQLDDGARSRKKLEQARQYLASDPDLIWRTKLHAIAGLSGQGIRSPQLLMEHTEQYLEAAKEVDDPDLIANALIMKSLTTVFADGELALKMMDEAVAQGERAGSPSTVMSARCFRAWHLAVIKDYKESMNVARALISDAESSSGQRFDNAVYNAIGTLVTCSALSSPPEAYEWIQRMDEFPAVSDFWVIQLLRACVYATNGASKDSAKICLAVQSKLRQAGKDDFPDVAVPAAVLAHQVGQTGLAREWLRAIRSGQRGEHIIQTYHMIVIYRQLYEEIGFAEEEPPDLYVTRNKIREFLAETSI